MLLFSLVALSTSVATADESCESAIERSQDSFVAGRYHEAIALLRNCREGAIAPKSYRLIGAASCFLRDREGALDAYERLDLHGRRFLRYVCARHQIALP